MSIKQSSYFFFNLILERERKQHTASLLRLRFVIESYNNSRTVISTKWFTKCNQRLQLLLFKLKHLIETTTSLIKNVFLFLKVVFFLKRSARTKILWRWGLSIERAAQQAACQESIQNNASLDCLWLSWGNAPSGWPQKNNVSPLHSIEHSCVMHDWSHVYSHKKRTFWLVDF